MLKLLSSTNAYKVILGDKKQNSLSHAYLVSCDDADYLRDFLKCLAKLILCDDDGCNECRVCRLIDRETHPDVSFYPKKDEKLKTKDADDIIANTLIKPLEIDKRLFVISGFEGFEKSQNKLLKTLEEPPKNVIILMGTTKTSSILPTVLSRAKKVDIPPFGEEKLFEYFSDKLPDKEKLKTAILTSNGKLGLVVKNYESGDFQNALSVSLNALVSLQTSRDVLSVSVAVSKYDANVIASSFKLIFSDLVKYKSGLIARLIPENKLKILDERYKVGAILEIIDTLGEIERALHFNANQTMIFDKMLFSMLEARHKWQKL